MNKSDFDSKTIEEMQVDLQNDVEKFKEEISEINDVEELGKLELEIDEQQAEFDKYLGEAIYDFPDEGIDFENKHYNRREVATRIIYHLNRIEKNFQYVLGLHSLILFWKNTSATEISYGVYDSTLRLLGELTFKGDREWTDMLIINNFMANINREYMKDRAWMIYLAEKRNCVVDRMQLTAKNNIKDAPLN